MMLEAPLMVTAVRQMANANVEIMSLVANVTSQNLDSMHQHYIRCLLKSKMDERQMAMSLDLMYKKVNSLDILERDTL